MADSPRIVYCHCAYAQVVPPEVKEQVLRTLADSGVSFESVPDLCEMAARRDGWLKEVAAGGPARIAACYPRAVKWLFASADAPLGEAVEILNMRTAEAGEIVRSLVGGVEEAGS